MIVHKARLAALIEYQRANLYKQTQYKEYAKEYFCSVILEHKRINICSPTTYRKMLSGIDVRNDDVYMLLLEKLRLSYDEKAVVYSDEFSAQLLRLRSLYECYDIDGLRQLCLALVKQMIHKDALEEEHKHVLMDIHAMYTPPCNGVYNSKRMEEIIASIDMYDPAIQTILEKAVYNHFVDTQQEDCIKPFLLRMPTCFAHEEMMLYYRIDTGVLADVEKDYERLITHYEFLHYDNMVFTIMMMKLKYDYQIGVSSEETLNALQAYLKNHDVHPDKYLSYLYFVAKKYNREQDYANAKQYFEELLDIAPQMTGIVLPYYMHTLVELNERIAYDMELDAYMSPIQKKLYQYFRIPTDAYLERENNIMKVVCKENILNDNFLVKSFLHELQKIVRVSKHYVQLDHFLRLTDEFL